RSTPRCWPPAYGCARSKEKGRSTGPSTGQVHARATDTGSALAHRIRTASRRTIPPLVANFENETDRSRADPRCQYWLQGAAVELVARRPRQPSDDVRRAAARHARVDELRDGF